MKIKLSIIIPVYNQEGLILKALKSIPKRNDIEIIVIDDCSTDNTVAVIQNNKWRYNNFVFLRNEKNMGVGFTESRGLDVATGEYVVRLDSDDYFYTNLFNLVINLAKGQDIVYFNLRSNDGQVFFVHRDNRERICGAVKLIRREFLGDIRCPQLRAEEDWHMQQALIKKEPVELYTHIIAKHYNWPREGSLCYLKSRGELEGFKAEDTL